MTKTTKAAKKAITLILAAIIALSLAIPAFAAKNITAAKAESIALADKGFTRSQVTLKKTVLDYDDGKAVYEVEFFVISNDYITEYEYEINASTGRIIDYDYDRELFIPANASVSVKSVGKASAVLTWGKVREADGYIVYRYTKKSGYTRVASTRSLSYKLTGLSAGKKYKYAVKAYIVENGKTGVSKKYSAVTFTTKTAAPSGVKVVSPKSGSVKVTFSKVTGAAEYLVQVSRTSSFSSVSRKTVTGTSAAFTGLKKGAKVYVRVFAYNAAGARSAASTVKTVTVK